MPSLRALRASFSFSERVPLLVDVSFHLAPGWTGLVGENGAGKTTLLRLLTRELKPTGGQLVLEPPDARVALCPQRVDAATEEIAAFSAAQDRYGYRLRGRLGLRDGMVERWETLSPGERKRWQVGAALYAEPEVLMLDEPTLHLDVAAREFLIAALFGFSGVGLVVSHDRSLLDVLTAQTLRLERGELTAHPGGYSQAKQAWSLEEAAAEAAREKARGELRKREAQLAETRRKQAAASAQKSTGRRMKDRYDSDARTLAAQGKVDWAQKTHGRKVASLHSAVERSREAIGPGPDRAELGRSVFLRYEPAPKPLLAALDGGPLTRGERVLLEDVRVAVHRTDRIALVGPNGAGKSTLVHALLSRAGLPPERVFHLPQELDAAAGMQTLDEVKALPPELRGRTLSLVAALGTDPDRLLASESPSPGEVRKLLLARGLASLPWWVVLDEPTNHLDLPSVERLEAALRAYPGALLLVTHDEALAEATTDQRWRLSEEQLIPG